MRGLVVTTARIESHDIPQRRSLLLSAQTGRYYDEPPSNRADELLIASATNLLPSEFPPC